MQGKIYWKLDVQNGPVREWSLSTENKEYCRQRSLLNIHAGFSYLDNFTT